MRAHASLDRAGRGAAASAGPPQPPAWPASLGLLPARRCWNATSPDVTLASGTKQEKNVKAITAVASVSINSVTLAR